jgi:hypothetical protein
MGEPPIGALQVPERQINDLSSHLRHGYSIGAAARGLLDSKTIASQPVGRE